MATMKELEMLMSQVGPVLDPIAIDEIEEGKVWIIYFAQDQLVFLKYNAANESLVISSVLGVPPAGDRTALYELLLQINFHLDAAGGLRMAVNSPGGEVVQMFEIGEDDFDVPRLCELLSSFNKVANVWREVVRDPALVAGATPSAELKLGLRV